MKRLIIFLIILSSCKAPSYVFKKSPCPTFDKQYSKVKIKPDSDTEREKQVKKAPTTVNPKFR